MRMKINGKLGSTFGVAIACIISLSACGRVPISNGVPATPLPIVLTGPSGVTQRTIGSSDASVLLPLATATTVIPPTQPIALPIPPTTVATPLATSVPAPEVPQPTAAPQPQPTPIPQPVAGADTGDVVCNAVYQHVVASGENLFRIALRFRTSMESIANANGIDNVALVRTGQTLKITACARVQTPTKPRAAGYYVVQNGDNLFRIGLKYNVSVPDLMTANGLNSNLIIPGQRIYLP